MIFVTRQAHFNAAHRLHNPDKSDEWNRQTFGKCNYPNWHGHNYIIEVTVAGEPDPETGFVIDLGKLKSIINEKILDPCDHRNLNLDVPFLQGMIPTTENLVRAFFEQLRPEVEAACNQRREIIYGEVIRDGTKYRRVLSLSGNLTDYSLSN
ncbi:6-pyruvoyl trahydropterin synthase family protein [Rhodohalobacter sp.]|uniref:6-pyruvoyl trahydropterin synthase family protein n=1 Tax=Rhodohalobacter sp. TaxID=1974210 RepID=UPI002ACF031B|nr:6-carboxytetrahydropterin synthase [Rhodohalobacter sp.]MDZ7756296.1 6-carboxytetrahydropterin synthase [Rhodohalobacter sp.]